MDVPRILLTGAAGRIGTAFYAEMADRYWFRLADCVPIATFSSVHEAVQFDISDLDACRAACHGIDSVIHLAADPSPDADFYESLLDNNIKGTFNIFRAATDAGVKRVVFASSMHTIAAHPTEAPLPIDVTVSPVAIYGATKCFGEALAAYFANAEGLSTISIRIGAYEAPWIDEHPTVDVLAAYVSPRDLNQLLRLCVDAPPTLRHAIVAGQSANRICRLDLTSTRELLGYAPLDDGFARIASRPD